MSEATIKNLAVELAGMHYDFVRSHEDSKEGLTARWPGGMVQQIEPLIFSKTYPTLKDFLIGRKHGRKVESYGEVSWEDTGQVTMGVPGHMFFYEIARQVLVQMLGREDVSDHRKKQVYDAIMEDREKQLKQERMRVKPLGIPQRKSIGG